MGLIGRAPGTTGSQSRSHPNTRERVLFGALELARGRDA